MKTTFQTLSIILWSLVFASPCMANDNDFAMRITQANIHHQNKQYQEAARAYEALIAEGFKNGHLYYNLGNTYFRLGQMGPAILNYLKARPLIPRDKDLEANLKSAYQETVDHLEGKQPVFLFWLTDLNQTETIQTLVILNLLFWLTAIARLLSKTGFWYLARNTLLCLLLVATVSAGAGYYLDTHNLSGVVLARTVDVKSTPEPDSITLFQLHEGAVASILEMKDDWYAIKLPDEKKGWVRKNSIGV